MASSFSNLLSMFNQYQKTGQSAAPKQTTGQGFFSMQGLAASMNAAGSILSSYETLQAAKSNALTLEYEARQVQKQGQETAGMIRKEGRKVYGAAVAELARSGGTGTLSSEVILDEITSGIENDAFNAILTGDSKALSNRFQAQQMKNKAKRDFTGSIFNAGMSLLGGFNFGG